MSEFELLEVLRAANEGVDTNFQFWLTSTFAVLMAFFFAGEKIVGYIKWVVVALFVSSSILYTYRISAAGRVATRARESLEEMGSDYLTISADVSTVIIGGSFMLIIFLGSIATVYFCLNSRKIMKI